MNSFQIIEILLLLGCCLLGGFCFSLTQKLRRLNNLETGIGGAIAVLVSEIARLEHSILLARNEALRATTGLSEEIERAKEERAYWVLQQKFTPHGEARPMRLRKRRSSDAERLDA